MQHLDRYLILSALSALLAGCSLTSLKNAASQPATTPLAADCAAEQTQNFAFASSSTHNVTSQDIPLEDKTPEPRKIAGASLNQNMVFKLCLDESMSHVQKVIEVSIVFLESESFAAGGYVFRRLIPNKNWAFKGLDEAIFGDFSKFNFKIDDGQDFVVWGRSLQKDGKNLIAVIPVLRYQEYASAPVDLREATTIVASEMQLGDPLNTASGPCGFETYSRSKLVLGTATLITDQCTAMGGGRLALTLKRVHITDSNPKLATPLNLILDGETLAKSYKFIGAHHSTCDSIGIYTSQVSYVVRSGSYAGAGCSLENAETFQGLPTSEEVSSNTDKAHFKAKYGTTPWQPAKVLPFNHFVEDDKVKVSTDEDKIIECGLSNESSVLTKNLTINATADERCVITNQNYVKIRGVKHYNAEFDEVSLVHTWECPGWNGTVFIPKDGLHCANL